MAIMQGDLAEYALPDLLLFLAGMRKHGQLIIEHPTVRNAAGVYFENGEVVHAYCPPREGVPAVFHLLRWKQGKFAFLKNAGVRTRTIEVGINNLLLEGMRQLDEHEHLTEQLPPGGTVLHLRRDEGQQEDVRLTQREWKFLGLVNGRRTLHQIVELSGLEDSEAQRTIYGLITSNLVTTAQDDGYLLRIIPERITTAEAAANRAFPPTMLANLVLRQIDGRRNLRELRIALGCGEAELTEEVALLLRTGWIRLRSGQETWDRYVR